MTLSISIDPQDPHGSDILSDEEDSSGVHVNSHDFDEDYDNEWAHLSYPDELKPSDSASRPRTSHRNRSLHGSRSASGRPNPARRRMVSERESYGTRSRRQPSPEESPDSGDSEEYPGHYSSRPPADRRYPQVPQAAGYATSNSSGMGTFPPGHAPPFAGHPNGHIPSALVRLGHADPAAQQYGAGHYPYGAQFQGPHGAAMHPFYGHDPLHPRHPSRPPPQSRMDPHMPGQPPMPPHLAGHVSPPGYAGSPYPQELMHYAQNPFYNYRDPYAMIPGMVPPPPYFPYPQVPSPSQPPEAAASPAPAPAPTPAPAAAAAAAAPAPAADTAKDEAIARLEKLIMDERQEREAKEAARLAQIEREKAEKAAREQQLAHDRKIAEEAAFLARADAEKRAAEAAAAAKEEAEKATAAAASEAAKAATAAATAAAEKAAADAAAAAATAAADAAKKKAAEEKKPPPEKKKPIKFKDAVGRKFSFPFELCETWQGMEDLIKQAFLHIEVIGPHVAEGHYDLVGPNGDIILPQVWETVVEPDWTITMHMWPIPEKPKEPDPPPAKKEEGAAAPAAAPPAAAPEAPKKKPEAVVKKPARRGGGGGFAGWMMGGRPPPKGPKPKAEKKPEPAPQ